MRKRSNKIIDVMSFLGIALLIVFVILAVHYAYYDASKPVIYYIIPYLTLVLGCFCFVFTLISTKKAYQMFLSIILIACGCIYSGDLIFHYGASAKEWWPVFAIIAGAAWCISGIYKYKRFNAGYAVPSLFLIGMSLWFMLFSFKIIKIPFSEVVKISAPVFIFMVIAFMIGLYFGQKKYKNLIIKNEEPGVFADEEMVLTDIESNKAGE